MYIFEHVIKINTFEGKLLLDEHLEDDEKVYILHLAKSSVHNKVVHFVVTEISEPNRQSFLYEVEKKPNSKKAHKLAKTSIKSYEKKVKKIVSQIEEELLDLLIH
jgi:hypothetical protein